MSNLYLGTQTLVDALTTHGIPVLEIEPHDADDIESADLIWLERDNSGGMYEGKYVTVAQSTYADSDRIDILVSVESAHLYGGNPTHWSELLAANDCDAIQAVVLKYWPLNKTIATEQEYHDTLSRIAELMSAEHGMVEAEEDEFEALVEMVEAYEAKLYPVAPPAR